MEKEKMLELIEKLDFENNKFYILVDLNNEIANYISKNKIREIIKKYGYGDFTVQKIIELLEEN